MDRRSALLHAKIHSFNRLVNKTSGFVRWALSRVETPYVACSFGKDSAVMLHIILEHKPDIPIRFIRWKNETEHIDNYDEVINEWGKINLTQIELCRESLNDNRPERYQTTQFDSYFIGLREDESTARRITLKANGIFYKNKAGLIRIAPLAEWSTRDIAAYVYSKNLPILKSYLQKGISSRTASRIPRSDYGIRTNFLIDLKRYNLAAYQQLLLKFPEIKQYV